MITKDKTRGFIAGVALTAILSVSLSAFAAAVEKQIKATFSGVKVTVDGKQVALKDANGKTLEPIGYGGSIYTPARSVAEALGASVTWDSTTNTVKIVSRQTGSQAGNRPDQSQMKEKVKTILESMVGKGTITQSTADKVLKYYNSTSSTQNAGARIDPLSEAVADGVITQAQADEIRKEIMPARPNN